MPQGTNIPDLGAIRARLARLQAALADGMSRKRCLRRWSDFIRERDGHRCVDCHSRRSLSAHHICRKSFLEAAQFLTGNGVTLCSACHKETHEGFNRCPDLSQPVDAQGGEKLQKMERLYSILTDDAVERGLMHEEFYFLSDEVLACFKQMQGYAPETFFPGARVEQAYLVLAEAEFSTRRAMLEADDMPAPDRPLLPGGMYLVFAAQNDQPRESIVIQNYVPRWKTEPR